MIITSMPFSIIFPTKLVALNIIIFPTFRTKHKWHHPIYLILCVVNFDRFIYVLCIQFHSLLLLLFHCRNIPQFTLLLMEIGFVISLRLYNNATMDITAYVSLYICVCISLGYVYLSPIASLYSMHNFNFGR